MDSESEMIPCLDFSKLGIEGSEEWKNMSKKLKDTCESYGCFIIMYDKNKIPKELFEEMLIGLKNLFDLPEEIKSKYTSEIPFRGYKKDISQSFGIHEVFIGDNAQEFTNLMWPQGNTTFCETLKDMNSKLNELSFLILKMILEGYGLPQKQYTSVIEDLKSSNHCRLMKYKVPENNKDFEASLLAHTDKGVLTILGQNEVQGLEILTKTNKWIQVNIPKEAFVVFVGDTLKAWSNGRLHPVTHRVMMKGEKERYSFALFLFPKEGVKIEVPPELVDDKIHYRPFIFEEYLNYFASTRKENALDEFSGV